MDGADRTQRYARDLGLPSSLPLCAARSRHEILRLVSVSAVKWRLENDSTAGEEPNLNAFAERWVRSVKQECLSKLILFGEGPLLRVLTEYSRHYHHERNHQGKNNRLLFPDVRQKGYLPNRNIISHQRLGGLLKYCQRAA